MIPEKERMEMNKNVAHLYSEYLQEKDSSFTQKSR